jgi:hypothetical protein
MAVKDISRLNNQDRAHFTKTVAAGLFYSHPVCQPTGRNFLAQGGGNLEGFSGPATGVADSNIFREGSLLLEDRITDTF